MGQVYTALDRLQREGFVDHEVVSQAERPDKKVYGITRKGRAELLRWIADATVPDLDLRNETFLKLMIARKVEGVDPLAIVQQEQHACMDRLSEVAGARQESRRKEDDLGTTLLLGLAARRLESFLQWLNDCQQTLGPKDEES